jgi:hypothetical protein
MPTLPRSELEKECRADPFLSWVEEHAEQIQKKSCFGALTTKCDPITFGEAGSDLFNPGGRKVWHDNVAIFYRLAAEQFFKSEKCDNELVAAYRWQSCLALASAGVRAVHLKIFQSPAFLLAQLTVDSASHLFGFLQERDRTALIGFVMREFQRTAELSEDLMEREGEYILRTVALKLKDHFLS